MKCYFSGCDRIATVLLKSNDTARVFHICGYHTKKYHYNTSLGHSCKLLWDIPTLELLL